MLRFLLMLRFVLPRLVLSLLQELSPMVHGLVRLVGEVLVVGFESRIVYVKPKSGARVAHQSEGTYPTILTASHRLGRVLLSLSSLFSNSIECLTDC